MENNQNQIIEKVLPPDVKAYLNSEKRTEESYKDCLVRLIREHKVLAYDLPEFIYMSRAKY